MMRRKWTAARWLGVSMTSLLVAAVLFDIGLWSGFALDFPELCTVIHNVPYDPPGPDGSGLTWPFSKKCNADHDLVPAYVNPGFITFGTVAVVAFVGFLVQEARARSAHPRRSRRSLNDDVT